jgi:hypothetical protein
MDGTVTILGRSYPNNPPDRARGQDRVGTWKRVVEALRFASDHCPSTERHLYLQMIRCLAMSESSLDRARPTAIDPLTELPWEVPMSCSFASRGTRRRGSVSSMAQQKSSERVSPHDSSRPGA